MWSQLPPWAWACLSAASSHGVTSWSADSKQSMSSACCPSPPAAIAASAGSSSRQLAGASPDRVISRTASAPAASEPNRTDAAARQTGGRCTRTQASVISPSVPSEPSRIRSGDTPAPEPGSRRDCQIPAGVTARTDSTRSSMCVGPVA
jgi:hypothetical protein